MTVPDKEDALAWNVYPEPQGTPYFESDLSDAGSVERLFDLCQILQAYVTAKGWRFLVTTYGVPGLLAINRRSGWFDDESDEEAERELRHNCLTVGYNPNTDQLGHYDEHAGVFYTDSQG